MALDLNEYHSLKTEVETRRKALERAVGALEATEKRMKADFGCKSFKEAKALLEEATDEEHAAERRLKKTREAFETKWKDVLNERTPSSR